MTLAATENDEALLRAFNITFDACSEAAEDYENRILVCHSWECEHGNGFSPEALHAREDEMHSWLGVMAGDKEKCYDDTSYVMPRSFAFRVQRGGPNGIIAAATCPISTLATPLFLSHSNTLSLPYSASSRTG